MIFKNGMRSFFVIAKAAGTQKEALRKANEHFKTKMENLEIQSGKMLDAETVKIGCKGDQWIISRKGKA